MSYEQMKPTPKEEVSLDQPMEQRKKVGLNAEDAALLQERVQKLVASMASAEKLKSERQELLVAEAEQEALQKKIESGSATAEDVARLEEVQSVFMEQQAAFQKTEHDRLEALRELAALDPDGYGDEYQLEKADFEARRKAAKAAIEEADEEAIKQLEKDIEDWQL